MLWPNNKKFCVNLTHDIDRTQKTFQYLTHFIKTKDSYHLKSVLDLSKKEPYWMFDKLINIERKYGVKSTFFFLNESYKFNISSPLSWKYSLGYYDINERKIKRVIKELVDGNWEIGLHGSIKSCEDENLLKVEKEGLEKISGQRIEGIRHHFLRYKYSDSWKVHKKLGFSYDASLGLKNNIGFPKGRLYPIVIPNFNFCIIPLTIMDCYLFDKFDNDLEKIWDACLDIINESEKNSALLSVLWHQRVFNDNDFPGYGLIYERIIEECMNRNALFATCREVTQYVNE